MRIRYSNNGTDAHRVLRTVSEEMSLRSLVAAVIVVTAVGALPTLVTMEAVEGGKQRTRAAPRAPAASPRPRRRGRRARRRRARRRAPAACSPPHRSRPEPPGGGMVAEGGTPSTWGRPGPRGGGQLRQFPARPRILRERWGSAVRARLGVHVAPARRAEAQSAELL